jgi:hypothetical protein
MPRSLKDLDEFEKDAIISTIFEEMYAEHNEDGIIVGFNPDKEVNGGDLVEAVGVVFYNFNMIPESN